jgi:hypothetical protein
MSDPKDDTYQKAVSKYDASYMSNAKWLRLFRTAIRAQISFEFAVWRYIDSDHSAQIAFPKGFDLGETRFNDGRFQPHEYKWIESVFIPNSYRPKAGIGYEKKQETAAFVEALAKVGKFPVEVSEDGITIVAYRRSVVG